MALQLPTNYDQLASDELPMAYAPELNDDESVGGIDNTASNGSNADAVNNAGSGGGNNVSNGTNVSGGGGLDDASNNSNAGNGDGANNPINGANIADNGDDDGDDDGGDEPSLQPYVEDDSKVPPEKRMNYIFMLSLQNVPTFDPRVNYPYSEFYDRTGHKRDYRFTKVSIIQELKRRNPGGKFNKSNKSVEQLLAMLTPLRNEADKQYVIQKESEYRALLTSQLQTEQADAENDTRMTPTDRERFAMLMEVEEIYSAYLRSQDCLTRAEVDVGTSGAGTEFREMAVEQLNSAEWMPRTPALATLHSEYTRQKTLTMGNYVWTTEKVKSYTNDVRRNLTNMIGRYELSGNGSNQAALDEMDITDVDTGNDGDVDENWGRFNAERARRIGEESGATNDGDDRANFLNHLPVDYLLTWYMFDKYNLVRFTCAQLSAENSASSHETPSPTSARNRRSRSSNQGNNEQLIQNQRAMVESVQRIGVSIASMSRANNEIGRAAKIRRIDDLKERRYKVALASATAAEGSREEAVHEMYLQEVSNEISKEERAVYGDSNNGGSNQSDSESDADNGNVAANN